MSTPLRLVSWNIARRIEPWRALLAADFDVALLQEAAQPPGEVEAAVEITPGAWETEGAPEARLWRTAIVRLSDRVQMEARSTAPLSLASRDQLPVSRMGTLAVADIEVLKTGERFTVASAYGLWEQPVAAAESSWSYADASAHRVLSDLSALVGREELPPLLVSGDLNIYRGYGEGGTSFWRKRYESVFSRAAALGLRYIGPQGTEGGHPADPWPDEVPRGCGNVPTFRKGDDSAAARHQIDYVFASEALADRVKARALNGEEEWGPSDHCRVEIEIDAAG